MIFLLVTPGRCASSFVSGVLHHELGIHMGNHFRADETNPNGFYEDLEFKNLNKKLLRGRISFMGFHSTLQGLVRRRNKKNSMWGVKDPRLSMLLGFYLQVLDDARVVYCKRDTELVINSFCRCYGFSRSDAEEIIRYRNKMITNVLSVMDKRFYLEIDTTEKITKEKIEEVIRGYFGFN